MQLREVIDPNVLEKFVRLPNPEENMLRIVNQETLAKLARRLVSRLGLCGFLTCRHGVHVGHSFTHLERGDVHGVLYAAHTVVDLAADGAAVERPGCFAPRLSIPAVGVAVFLPVPVVPGWPRVYFGGVQVKVVGWQR